MLDSLSGIAVIGDFLSKISSISPLPLKAEYRDILRFVVNETDYIINRS